MPIRAVICDFGGVLTSPLIGCSRDFQKNTGVPICSSVTPVFFWKLAKAPISGEVSTPPKSQMTARIGTDAFCRTGECSRNGEARSRQIEEAGGDAASWPRAVR